MNLSDAPTKRLRLVILSVLLTVPSTSAASLEIVEKPATIQSPTDWALGYFHAIEGGESQLARLQIDLDHDGADELFLGWNALRGRNGLPFVVFKRSATGYRFLGPLFFRENLMGFRVLPLAKDGSLRFAQYGAHGGCEGTISIYTHDGTRFTLVESEEICSGDGGTEQGNRRMREVFPDQAR